jgi:ankyrin repeat protein
VVKFCRALQVVVLASLVIAYVGLAATAQTNPIEQKHACDRITRQYKVALKPVEGRHLNEFLFDASGRGCVDLVKKFLTIGASVRARDRFGNTALSIASRMGQRSVAKLLIARGANINQRNLAGSSALLRAVTERRRPMVRLLLKEGADTNIPNNRGVTPLIAAAFNGDARIVKALLAAGAKPDVRDTTGKGPVVYAAGRGFTRIVTMMLKAGLDPGAVYGNNLTGLMWAAGHSNDVPESDGLDTVELFLARNVEINSVDDRGRTALMIAAERGHAQIVMRLLAAGAKSEQRDRDGKTAFDLGATPAVRKALSAR